jgi:hypothetical protein
MAWLASIGIKSAASAPTVEEMPTKVDWSECICFGVIWRIVGKKGNRHGKSEH